MNGLTRSKFLKLAAVLGGAGMWWTQKLFAADTGRKAYINGELVGESEAKVSVFDHGFLYGDGVFEGIRAYEARVFRLEDHVDRLYESARSILLNVPLEKNALTKAILQTVRANGLADCYIRPLVTRGVGNLGLNPKSSKEPGLIILIGKVGMFPADRYETGIVLTTCATRRVSIGALSPAIKSMNYLNNILGKIEANTAGADEGLMLNAEDYVAECTGENLFIVRDGALFTPPISAGALAGITRRVTFEMAREMGLAASDPNLTRQDIYTADECFLTGTGAEIIPVATLDGRPIGSGEPGPITRRLMERYHSLTHTTGTPV